MASHDLHCSPEMCIICRESVDSLRVDVKRLNEEREHYRSEVIPALRAEVKKYDEINKAQADQLAQAYAEVQRYRKAIKEWQKAHSARRWDSKRAMRSVEALFTLAEKK
jgi:hypothetical protein